MDGIIRIYDVATGRCIRILEAHNGDVQCIFVSADCRWVLSGGSDKVFRMWELDWEFDVIKPVQWDEAARPYLLKFLALRRPYAGSLPQDRDPTENEIHRALTREGKPTWTETVFQGLLQTLACCGYGWIQPEGIRRELEKVTLEWRDQAPERVSII